MDVLSFTPPDGRHRLADDAYDDTEELVMALTGQTVRDALAACGAIWRQMRSFDDLAAGADGALRQAPAGLTAQGAASFLATCAQESDWFRTTREYGSGQRYAPFIGRGFVQCTWQSNYAAFGAWCARRGLLTDPNTFVRTPVALEDYRWAWLTAVWYFEANGLWRYANAGSHYAVSQGVNRGVGAIGSDKAPLHWDTRRRAYEAFVRAGNALLPTGALAPAAAAASSARPTLREGDSSELIWQVQTFMNRVFPAYSRIDVGSRPPSRCGPQTVAVLTEFQRRSGIPTTPPFEFGPKSWAALDRAGFR